MIGAILQARSTSRRLPHKVLLPILGQPMLARQIERIRLSRTIDSLSVATSMDPSDDSIEALCREIGVYCFRGSLDNVLDRFYGAASELRADTVVRLTGDCPLIDATIMDEVINFFRAGHYDYASNALQPTFPDGLDVEVLTFQALEMAWKEAVLTSEREHVTPFIHTRPDRFRLGHYKGKVDLSHLRWTVDEERDLDLVRKVYESLYPSNPSFGMEDILDLLNAHPDWCAINSTIVRNEGFKISLEKDGEAAQNGRNK